MLDFRMLEDFLNVAQTGSFSRSAKERHVTQPAFSRRIRSLELWAGAPLIDRSTYPTTLTPAGRIFQSAAEDILRRLALAQKDVVETTGSDRDMVAISVLHTLSLTFVPKWLQMMAAQGQPLNARFHSDNMHDCVNALVEGATDLLLCFTHPSSPLPLDPSRYPSLQLGTDLVVPVSVPGADGSPRFKLPGRREAPSSSLAYTPESYLGRLIEQMVLSRRERPFLKRVYENSFTEALKASALAGHGLAWLPLQTVEADLAAGRLVHAGPLDWSLEVSIRIYRPFEPCRTPVEALWTRCIEAQSMHSAT